MGEAGHMGAKTNSRYSYDPDYAVPPGETLLETLEELGMTQAELAMRLELSQKHVSEIVHGKAPITHGTAIGLERATGVPAHFWNKLETNYRERLACIEDEGRLLADPAWLRTIPIDELIKRGVIPKHSDETALLKDVLAFFGVSSSRAFGRLVAERKVAARKAQCFVSRPGPTMTWLRLGELAAMNVRCGPYNRKEFQEAVGEIRGLTAQPPETFIPRLRELCASSGVAVVFIREIGGAPWYGASWWATPRKGVIELNLRGKSDDQFWFSFYHEVGHILLGSKKGICINDGNEDDPEELQANQSAANVLIPADRAAELRGLPRTYRAVSAFARSIDIAPGIVVGRMQKEGLLPYSHLNRLKRKLAWRDD